MDPHAVTAVTPFRLLDLPREIRDDIYEAAIFDLSPPDMFMSPEDPDSTRFRKMNTNVLLMNRQVYWEARNVIVRRGQLVMVSISCLQWPLFDKFLTALSGITGIDPAYRNLCIMSHYIDLPEASEDDVFFDHDSDPAYEPEGDWEFILHRQDTDAFLRVLMGDLNVHIGIDFIYATHTLDLHGFPTYGQHEFSSVYTMQTLILQKYRQGLRNFRDFSIEGASIGWEDGLYSGVLQDIRSIDDREPTELIEDIRALEQKGSQTLLLTGDVEAADVYWAEALAKCLVGNLSFHYSSIPDQTGISLFPNAFETHVRRWIRLKRQHGNECAFPFFELWHKLIRHRLSGVLRFLEQGHHLADRHGHPPRPKDDYIDLVSICCADLSDIWDSSEEDPWSPQPADEAQLCLTVVAIFRILEATDQPMVAVVSYKAVLRAAELAPDDESIQQYKDRVESWIRRRVDEGTLERFPSSDSLAQPWWTGFYMAY